MINQCRCRRADSGLRSDLQVTVKKGARQPGGFSAAEIRRQVCRKINRAAGIGPGMQRATASAAIVERAPRPPVAERHDGRLSWLRRSCHHGIHAAGRRGVDGFRPLLPAAMARRGSRCPARGASARGRGDLVMLPSAVAAYGQKMVAVVWFAGSSGTDAAQQQATFPRETTAARRAIPVNRSRPSRGARGSMVGEDAVKGGEDAGGNLSRKSVATARPAAAQRRGLHSPLRSHRSYAVQIGRLGVGSTAVARPVLNQSSFEVAGHRVARIKQTR